MVDETEVILSKDDLLAQMKEATDAGDWKAMSKISSKVAKIVATEDKAEKDVQLKILEDTTVHIKSTLDKVVNKIVDGLDKEVLDAMSGVWYVNDFGEALTTCRLVKGAARKGGGGGGGKKFSISTKELLDKHGAEQMGDSGMTFQEAYDSDTGGNARYKVRMKLLKAEGVS